MGQGDIDYKCLYIYYYGLLVVIKLRGVHHPQSLPYNHSQYVTNKKRDTLKGGKGGVFLLFTLDSNV